MGGLAAARRAPRRVGVVGGTFDPPHLAHLAAGAAARAALDLDWVLFVPAGDPWRKRGRPVTPAAERLRLLRAALGPLGSWAEASAMEVERSGPSHTWETLAELERAHPGDERWVVLGADALADLPAWRRPREIVARARLALVDRPGQEGGVPAGARRAVPGLEALVDRVPMPPLRVSSSDLRRRVRAGLPTAPLLPRRVRELVDELGLYG